MWGRLLEECGGESYVPFLSTVKGAEANQTIYFNY